MSMIKVIPPDSWDFGEEPVQLVKVASSGLRGRDLSDLVKRAGHAFAHSIKNAELKPGDVPVHVIALGATESYGLNRNSDGFSIDTCRKCHPTFVKFAKFRRNHQNKDSDKSYGFIKDSAFNEDMKRVELFGILNGTKEAADRNNGSVADEELKLIHEGKPASVSMACSCAGTLVKVKDGFTPIEKIQEGDDVLTHRGRYRRVLATAKRVKQHYAKIYTRGYGRQTIEFTPDHLFYVSRWEDLPTKYGRNRKDPTGFEKTFRQRYRATLTTHARWLPCGDLKKGDLLLMPIVRGDGSSTLSKNEARLLGYYISEGSLAGGQNGASGVVLTCNKKDEVVDEIKELVGDRIDVVFGKHSASDQAFSIGVHSKEYAVACENEIGRGVRNKVIPRRIYDAPAEMKLEFISTWFNGDGWQDVKGMHWSTCSRSLSLELQMLLASVDIPASVYRIDHTSDLPHGCVRKGDGIEYTVNINNHFSHIFSTRSKAVNIEKKNYINTTFISGDYLAVPVKKVELIEKEVDVYDLSVDDDESFTAFGLAVHNCKVAHDVCLGCGNKAKNKNEYCTGIDEGGHCKRGGVKNRLTFVHDDGFINGVDNPNPKWFDMSKVFRGADRIAYMHGMNKAASSMVLGGAALAEQYGIELPYELRDEQELWPTAVTKLARHLASFETSDYSDYDRTFAVQTPVKWNDHNASKHQALAALMLNKIAMPLEGFVELVLEKEAQHLDIAKQLLPGVYGRLLSDGVTQDMLKPYLPCGQVTTNLLKWASARAEDYSLSMEHVDRRAQLANLYGFNTPIPRKQSLVKVAGAAEDIARGYALYKLAFLQLWQNDTPDFDLISKLTVRQNYLQ